MEEILIGLMVLAAICGLTTLAFRLLDVPRG